MKLELFRIRFSDRTTQGELWVDGKTECWTLEDKRREPGEPKVYGETAIPEGEYEIELAHSERFNRVMPYILDVPNFTGIMFHPGNTEWDTAGCILVGLSRSPDRVWDSRLAFNRLLAKLEDATRKGEDITLRIVYNPLFT